MSINKAIKALENLRNQVGGDTPIIFPSGTTEDDWDIYNIYSQKAYEKDGKHTIMIVPGERVFTA